ncbi:hypothetical protein Fcan01_23288 [Folsomia candida]|uniref:Uncharacterized protein n=1 Tax=Folsomia candida TaxID=158441 RepID=A0A226DAN3_FOLCA|nr:hypothetical protein Fcan01_23288 [Folsomia candida]
MNKIRIATSSLVTVQHILLCIPVIFGYASEDQTCLLIYREYQPDDYFRSFIYFTATSKIPETARAVISWTIFSHTLPPNETSLQKMQPHFGSNCVVIFPFLVDFNSYPNLQYDQKTLFANYYNSPEAVFIIGLHQHVFIPWGRSPSSAYLSFSSSPKYADYFVLKDGYVGGAYVIIPPNIPIWDIFKRKWRPSVALH